MLINPRNIQAVARKEIFHIVRDYRSLYMAFALPLLLILLFGYALYVRDPVFIIGQGFGVFVYMRNLYFIRRDKSGAAVA